jgi:hypothetical protein
MLPVNIIFHVFATRAQNIAQHRFRAQLLLHAPPGLTFSNSRFCPHSVFACVQWRTVGV